MKNKELNIKELNIKELNIQELIAIGGGSPFSDNVCFYAGRVYGFLSSFGLGATEGSANRFA